MVGEILSWCLLASVVLTPVICLFFHNAKQNEINLIGEDEYYAQDYYSSHEG